METRFALLGDKIAWVLIVPCGMETFLEANRELITDSINCTLRNGNYVRIHLKSAAGSY